MEIVVSKSNEARDQLLFLVRVKATKSSYISFQLDTIELKKPKMVPLFHFNFQSKVLSKTDLKYSR